MNALSACVYKNKPKMAFDLLYKGADPVLCRVSSVFWLLFIKEIIEKNPSVFKHKNYEQFEKLLDLFESNFIAMGFNRIGWHYGKKIFLLDYYLTLQKRPVSPSFTKKTISLDKLPKNIVMHIAKDFL